MTTRVTTNKTKPKYSCLKCGKTSQDVHNYEYLIRLYPGNIRRAHESSYPDLYYFNDLEVSNVKIICHSCSKHTTVEELLQYRG